MIDLIILHNLICIINSLLMSLLTNYNHNDLT